MSKTKYTRLMSRSRQTESGELHQAGENCKLRYEGIGTDGIKVRHENITVTITIKDVLFVPELRENLLSTTVLTSKGYTLVQGRAGTDYPVLGKMWKRDARHGTTVTLTVDKQHFCVQMAHGESDETSSPHHQGIAREYFC
ncbi:uncharacterized protein LOC143265784 isoform X11 [Megachile rotundata]|uniref:uncharacterized protein LOC143265784 isoform X11 n=1 Tax=Megachile rotundata TaxID=143995 RepID=UPI003FD10057